MSSDAGTADAAYRRPQLRLAPSPTAESKAFWTGGRRGELLSRLHSESVRIVTERAPSASQYRRGAALLERLSPVAEVRRTS